ncbi:MAG: hypothetical protein DRZ79_01655, partial [Candidatus Cloacimonadota bacterium]
FDKLAEIAKDKSRRMISEDIRWSRMENKKQSAIILSVKGNIKNKNDWNNQFEWFKKYLEAFINFFKPIIKEKM